MQLSDKQNEYIRQASHRWNLKIGAVRSGKSFVDIAHMIPYRLRLLKDEPGLNVFLGVSKATIERNILAPMREIFTDRLVGTISQGTNIARVCGVDVYCLGAEKVSQVAKIQGASIKYAYGDEIAKWNREVFTMLQSRLDKPYSCFDGSCNPEYPGHWLKEFLDREDIDAYIQKYTLFDNPFLPESFVDNLCREYAGTVYYDRLIRGEWTMAAGLIYPMYKQALVDKLSSGAPDQAVLSIDYGTMNAFAALYCVRFDETWYIADEYYYSGRDEGVPKTDEEYAAALDRFIRGRVTAGQKIRTIVDPSAASFIALLRKRGQYRVIPADNAVADGLRETATALASGTLKILQSCKNVIQEAQGYVWDDSAGEDRPVKENDHAMDAMRYFVKTLNITRPRSTYVPLLR